MACVVRQRFTVVNRRCSWTETVADAARFFQSHEKSYQTDFFFHEIFIELNMVFNINFHIKNFNVFILEAVLL